jgi:hypothetical protein
VDVRVLAVTDMFTAGGPRDVIAISAGRAQGVDNGTVFSLWRPGRHVAHRMKYPTSSRMDDSLSTGAGRVSLPDEYAAHAMVFRTFDNVSYALVMQGVKPARGLQRAAPGREVTVAGCPGHPGVPAAGRQAPPAKPDSHMRRRPRAPLLHAADSGG